MFSLWLCSQHSLAGSFSINPVSLELTIQRPIQVITVRNEGIQTAIMQLDIDAWKQTNNQEYYTETRDLLATPPIFSLPPGKSQIIRIGMRKFADSQREVSYRMFISEVPQNSTPRSQNIAIALRISIPIFVVPDKPMSSNLLWQATPLKGKGYKISVSNKGNVHANISALTVYGTDILKPILKRKLFTYLLPDSEHAWILDAKSESRLHLIAEIDNRETVHDLMLNQSGVDK